MIYIYIYLRYCIYLDLKILKDVGPFLISLISHVNLVSYDVISSIIQNYLVNLS